jgi:hypothetical protein
MTLRSPALTRWRCAMAAASSRSPVSGSVGLALRNAAQLCRALTTTVEGGDITTAIGQYEDQMRDYGCAAVAASAKAEAERGTLRNPLLSWLYRRVARA